MPVYLADNHKGLVHLLGQRNLSGRQARWLEKIAEYNYEVQYVLGVDNVLADALSRIYSNDAPGTVRAASEYTQFADEPGFSSRVTAHTISMPVYAGVEVFAAHAGAGAHSPAALSSSQRALPIRCLARVAEQVVRVSTVPAELPGGSGSSCTAQKGVQQAALEGRSNVPGPGRAQGHATSRSAAGALGEHCTSRRSQEQLATSATASQGARHRQRAVNDEPAAAEGARGHATSWRQDEAQNRCAVSRDRPAAASLSGQGARLGCQASGDGASGDCVRVCSPHLSCRPAQPLYRTSKGRQWRHGLSPAD